MKQDFTNRLERRPIQHQSYAACTCTSYSLLFIHITPLGALRIATSRVPQRSFTNLVTQHTTKGSWSYFSEKQRQQTEIMANSIDWGSEKTSSPTVMKSTSLLLTFLCSTFWCSRIFLNSKHCMSRLGHSGKSGDKSYYAIMTDSE